MSTGEIIGVCFAAVGLCAMVPVWWLNSRLLGDKIKMTQQESHIKSLQHQLDDFREELKISHEKLNLLPLLEERIKNLDLAVRAALEKIEKLQKS